MLNTETRTLNSELGTLNPFPYFYPLSKPQRMSFRLILFLFIVMVGASCVPNRSYQYLQKDDVNKKDMKRDTTLRGYHVKPHDYRIQPQDVLSIRFQSLTSPDYDFFSKMQSGGTSGTTSTAGGTSTTVGNPMLSGELVDEKGEVPFPVIGSVKVAGLTVFEIQSKLQAMANQYLESPIVRVRLMNFRATIIGEVKREGQITFNNNRVSLLEAIALGGGATDFADKSSVKLIRQTGDSIDVQYINLLKEEFVTSPYFYIHQNDIIVVPPARQRPLATYFGTNLALLVSALTLVVLVLNLTKQ